MNDLKHYLKYHIVILPIYLLFKISYFIKNQTIFYTLSHTLNLANFSINFFAFFY